jgi:hypothetical protein
LWDLSRIVRADASLTQLFDDSFASGTIDSVTAGSMLIKIAGSKFSSALQTFMIDHGGRAPNEWDPAASSYESHPALAFIQIDRLRHQDDSADPHKAHARNSAERERLYNEFLDLLSGDPETSGAFAASYASSGKRLASVARATTSRQFTKCGYVLTKLVDVWLQQVICKQPSRSTWCLSQNSRSI